MARQVESRRRRGRPTGGSRLTRQQIVETALRTVDAVGLEGLTMRRLAQELDVDPMSIYHHVPNKAALVSGMVDLVFSDMDVPEPGSEVPWDERVRAWVRAYRDLTQRHPNLVLQIVTDPAAVSRAAAIVDQPMYDALRDGGVSETAAVDIAGMFVDYVNGYALPGIEGTGTAFDRALEIMLAGIRSVSGSRGTEVQ